LGVEIVEEVGGAGEMQAKSKMKFAVGDRVKVTKISTKNGETAPVTDPDWTGRVKVSMDGTGETKSYKASELALLLVEEAGDEGDEEGGEEMGGSMGKRGQQGSAGGGALGRNGFAQDGAVGQDEIQDPEQWEEVRPDGEQEGAEEEGGVVKQSGGQPRGWSAKYATSKKVKTVV
jgi:hypothetical protein